MRAVQNVTPSTRRKGRTWRFATAALDESRWTLLVDNRRVAIEAKPLEVLHELLLRAGDVVTKAELMDAIWPEVSVVEASLPTAVLKLRRALGDDKGNGQIIETVPRIGYRLAVPVEIEARGSRLPVPADTGSEPAAERRWPLVAAGVAFAVAAVALTASQLVSAPKAAAAPAYTQRDAADAIRKLDVAAIEKLLRAGWDPNTTFDPEGNGALNILLNVCEWDPDHDRRKFVLLTRTLLEGGAILDRRNGFGDTAYSIAKAKRYCGPDHPATRMLRTMCYSGTHPPGDNCLASYELARRR